MIKSIEQSDPNSCWNKAEPGELVFVLLERDVAAPDVIRAWAEWRVYWGKNHIRDPEITEAFKMAMEMEARQRDKYGCEEPIP